MFNINEKTCKPQIGMNEKLKNYDKKKEKSLITREVFMMRLVYIYIHLCCLLHDNYHGF